MVLLHAYRAQEGVQKREGDERGGGWAGVGNKQSKKCKITTIIQATATLKPCNTPPTITVTATEAHTISAGRGSKHCRDFSIASHQGSRPKRRKFS